MLSKKRSWLVFIFDKLQRLILFLPLTFWFFSFFYPSLSLAATYNWDQDGWLDGEDISTGANHAANQTDWTKYYSKDDNLTVESGLVRLTQSSSQLNYDNTNFSSSTLNNLTLNASNQLQLELFQGSKQVVAGSSHTCALKTDGTVWCWGSNYYGQLGNNSTNDKKSPVQVLGVGGSGTLTGVTEISVGYAHTCALKTDGTVWCWGYNSSGQLGNNSTTQQLTPAQVLGVGGSGTLTGVTEISAGYAHTCALKTDGTVWCWGSNSSGQLGNNSTTRQLTPVQVLGVGGSGTLTGVTRIAAGNYHTCALKTEGTVWCWGYNYYGQLGNNFTTQQLTPVQVLGVGGSGTLTGVAQIAAGSSHTCALKTDGTVWCWGSNSSGQLGNNSTTQQLTPVQVLGVGGSGTLTGATQISVGYAHTCVLKTEGTVWCWGNNSYGQLGNDSTTQQNTPVQVLGVGGSGILTGVAQISVGFFHTCALKTDDTAWCWGSNSSGQLGNNSTDSYKDTVMQVLFNVYNDYFNDVSQISTGIDHTCALKTDGTVWCWGNNWLAQLGNNSDSNKKMLPTQVLGVGGSGTLTGVTQIATGDSYTCALKTEGTVWCWGTNYSGQLGNNSTTRQLTPVQVLGVGGSGTLTGVAQIAAGSSHTCALKTDGTVWCWGSNSSGQLGNNSTNDKKTPVQVLGVGGSGTLTGVTEISVGYAHTCALKTDGTVWCWGYNSSGQLGNNSTTQQLTPVQVLGVGGSGTLTGATEISVGYAHTCALKTDGTVWCWGSNSSGQLGNNSTTQQLTPVQVLGVGGSGTLTGVTEIVAGGNWSYSHTCALKNDETVWCWGYNSNGELGNNSTTQQLTPVQVLGVGGSGTLTGVTEIAAGSSYTCALKNDETVWCWGDNYYGQLGNPLYSSKSTAPTFVFDPEGRWNLNLSAYHPTGSLISPIIDLNQSVALKQLSSLKQVASLTNIKFQFRSAAESENIDSAPWLGPEGENSYFTTDITDINSFSLARYFQYRVILETSNSNKTPTLSSLSLGYQAYAPLGILVSSPYDSQSDENLISGISWVKSLPDKTSIKFQLRSAANQNDLSSQDWRGPDGTAATFFTNSSGNTTPNILKDQASDRWFQYKMILGTDDGGVTPSVYSTRVTYVVNSPPQFSADYQTNGFGINRELTPGIFHFLYKVRDIDTSQGSTGNQYRLWPSFQYSIDDGTSWTTISASHLTGYNSNSPLTLADDETYVEGTTVWDATQDLPNTYANVKVRIIIDDHEAANNTAIVNSDPFVLDTKKPATSTIEGGGSGININHNQTTALAIDKTNNPNVILYFGATDDSDFQLRYSTSASFSDATYQDYVSSVNFTLPTTTDGAKRVYAQFKDAYGNESDVYSDVIQLDTTAPEDDPDLYLQDVSNPNTNDARIFLNWRKNSDSDWQEYRIYRSENDGAFSLIQSISNVNSNYILEDNLINTYSYIYKVTNIDDLGNESTGSTVSQTVWGNPTDLVAPTISNIQISNKTTSSVTVSWTTNEVANASVLYSTDETYAENQVGTGYNRQHSLVLSGLTAGTQYHFKIRATDPSGNSTDSLGDTFTTNTPDTTGPVISNISTNNLAISRVDISFVTDELASSFVEYSTETGFTSGTVFGQNDFATNHTVSLRALTPSTVYYYKVRSVDATGNQSVSSEQTFTTSTAVADTTAPTISGVAALNIKYNTATIAFTTNEAASSFIEFGKDTAYGRVYGQDNSVTGHTVTLPYDLTPETTYYYRVRTKDMAGNETIGAGLSFTTAADPQDVVAPVISNVTISEPQQNSVTITWITNEPATSYIGFSQDNTYAQEQGNSVMVQNHSITLVGLNPKTVYYFKIKSADPSGNLAYDNNANQGYQFATANGPTPPTIYSNQIKSVTTSTANIYWETNIAADSFVEYGLDMAYGNLIGINTKTTAHTISLTGLLSGTTYNFRVKSATASESAAVSQNFTLTTQNLVIVTPPEIPKNDPSEETILDKIKNGTVDFVKKVINVISDSSISEDELVDSLNSMTPKIVSSPSISSSNITVDPGIDKITISWTTDKKANSVVLYTPDSGFVADNPVYAAEVGKYDEAVVSHSVELTNLSPNTTYHYKVRSKSEYGNWTDSNDFTFTTLSINSEIRDFRFTKVTQKTVAANWSTTFDSRAMFEVTDVLTGKSITKSEEKGFARDHSFTADGLQTATNYQLQITTVAKDGSLSETSIFPFSTANSSEPPVISSVRISNALISGSVEQVQTIISWKTDKPATSRIFYNEGTGNDLSLSTNLDKSLAIDHVVVTTGLKPGKVYKFKAESIDTSENSSLSKDYLIMTPKTKESVVNLIIDNFMESFSFITKGRK